MTFSLHQRLAADTVEICDLELCLALLMDDARFPWLILVPRRQGLRDFDDVAQADRPALMADIARASDALREECAPDKINVAAIGNMVEQLHIHVVARFRGDAVWPAPVWGAGAPVTYGEAERAARVVAVRRRLQGD